MPVASQSQFFTRIDGEWIEEDNPFGLAMDQMLDAHLNLPVHQPPRRVEDWTRASVCNQEPAHQGRAMLTQCFVDSYSAHRSKGILEVQAQLISAV